VLRHGLGDRRRRLAEVVRRHGLDVEDQHVAQQIGDEIVALVDEHDRVVAGLARGRGAQPLDRDLQRALVLVDLEQRLDVIAGLQILGRRHRPRGVAPDLAGDRARAIGQPDVVERLAGAGLPPSQQADHGERGVCAHPRRQRAQLGHMGVLVVVHRPRASPSGV
jgi:hypothetical protein